MGIIRRFVMTERIAVTIVMLAYSSKPMSYLRTQKRYQREKLSLMNCIRHRIEVKARIQVLLPNSLALNMLLIVAMERLKIFWNVPKTTKQYQFVGQS